MIASESLGDVQLQEAKLQISEGSIFGAALGRNIPNGAGEKSEVGDSLHKEDGHQEQSIKNW